GFGATVDRLPGRIRVSAPDGLKAFDHWPDYASVTTTENFVMCAALANGSATLTNAASEPHVQEFCRFMAAMGARIDGIGTSRLTVHGVEQLRGVDFSFVEDFHEVVTFLALSAITGGDIEVKNGAPEFFPLIDRTFAKFGIHIEHRDGWSRARFE
ncbi:UDP-N-acetylglucosamine 1-carboxyvinyltransferase, partial [Pseudomonas sp. MWU12-2323]|nr:UDP-N-acetylglucosamine 1-carboxyvinyltransferase [Pseudomonas sp. MWU12-2323]